LAGLISICGVVWRAHVSRQPHENKKPSKPPSDLSAKFERIRGLKIRSKGKTVWHLVIDSVQINKQRTLAEVDGLKEAVYYLSGRQLLSMSAKKAIWNMLTNDIEVWGDVCVRLNTGLQMRMERLNWHDSGCVLQIPSKVIGESKSLRFVAMGVVYEARRSLLRLLNGVFACADDAQFYCRQLDISIPSGEYTAHPPVRLVLCFHSLEEELEVKPITVETITQLIGLGNTASPEQKEKKAKGEKEERRIVFESLTQPLKRVGRKVYGADVTVREEGEDYTITVKHFTYDESKEYLVADGMVRYEDPDVILTAPKAELFRRERRLLLVGKVHLESKPRESPQNASAKNGSKSQQGGEEELPLRERIRRKPTVIDCEQLEYFYRERRAVAKGNLKFKHGQYAGSASTVTYWHREDKLLAEGKVVVNDLEEGHLFECTSVTILLANDERKEDEIIVAPGARALIKVKEEEEETKPSEEKTKQQEERKTPPKVEEKTKP